MVIYGSNIYGGGGVPVGDKLRFGTAMIAASGGTTTVLTVASGGGVFHGIYIGAADSGTNEDSIITNVKVTVDGASERTLDMSAITMRVRRQASSAGVAEAFFFPLPIAFADSLTVKISYGGGPNNTVMAVYSVL
jgi:hypothetical protein